MSTKKTTAKKPDNTKAEMEANAKIIRGNTAKKKAAPKPAEKKEKPAKTPAAKKSPAVKPAAIVVAKKLEVFTEERSKVAEIMERCVTLSGPQKLVSALSEDMTKAEVLAVYDGLLEEQEGSGPIRIGTFLMHAKNLPALGGAEKFEIAMAKSGRGISSVRKYLTLVERTAPELLSLPGIKYTAAAATVTIKDPEKKAELFREISEAHERGEDFTVDEVKKKVAKIAPPAKKSTPKPPAELTEDQKDILAQFEEKITAAHIFFQSADEMKFLYGAPKGDTEELARMLGNLAKLNSRL